MQLKRSVILAIFLAGLAGCRPVWEENSDDDSEQAREVLIVALDAWKAGKPGKISHEGVPVRFGDDDQLTGMKLIGYVLKDPDAPIHPFRDVAVELTLQDSQGKEQRKVATYQIGLDPHISVLRSDN